MLVVIGTDCIGSYKSNYQRTVLGHIMDVNLKQNKEGGSTFQKLPQKFKYNVLVISENNISVFHTIIY